MNSLAFYVIIGACSLFVLLLCLTQWAQIWRRCGRENDVSEISTEQSTKNLNHTTVVVKEATAENVIQVKPKGVANTPLLRQTSAKSSELTHSSSSKPTEVQVKMPMHKMSKKPKPRLTITTESKTTSTSGNQNVQVYDLTTPSVLLSPVLNEDDMVSSPSSSTPSPSLSIVQSPTLNPSFRVNKPAPLLDLDGEEEADQVMELMSPSGLKVLGSTISKLVTDVSEARLLPLVPRTPFSGTSSASSGSKFAFSSAHIARGQRSESPKRSVRNLFRSADTPKSFASSVRSLATPSNKLAPPQLYIPPKLHSTLTIAEKTTMSKAGVFLPAAENEPRFLEPPPSATLSFVEKIARHMTPKHKGVFVFPTVDMPISAIVPAAKRDTASIENSAVILHRMQVESTPPLASRPRPAKTPKVLTLNAAAAVTGPRVAAGAILPVTHEHDVEDEEEEEEELDVYELDKVDITSLTSSPELFGTQRKMPAGQISVESGNKSHLPSSLPLASRPPLPARRSSSDAPMPAVVKEEQQPHVRSGSIVFDPYRASQETKARAEFVTVDVRQPRRTSQPAVSKDDFAAKRRVSWSEGLLPGQAESPKSRTVPVEHTTFSAEGDASSAASKQPPKRSQSGTLPYKKSRTKEFSDVGADSRILELTSSAPLLTLPFSEVFAISFWGTHRLFSFFSRPYKGHNSASRVFLFVSILYFQLAAIGALYNYWELSYDTQCTFLDCLPRIKLQDLFLAATVTAICIPLSVFLLLLLASEQQVGFIGQRQLADKLRGSLYQSDRKKFSKFCLVGYLGCVVCLSLSLAFIGNVKIAQFTLEVPINHMWLAMWLVTFVMDVFVGELIRIFSHAFFLSWLTKPGGGDPWVKLRVVKFWFAYIVLAFLLYLLLIVIGGASDRIQVWLESYSSLGAVMVFFLVANFSSLMLFGFILLFRPPIWSEHPKEWDNFKQLSLQHIREVALLITCHLSADILQQTLEAALHVFTPSQIFVCDNGRWTNPLDLWECCETDCAMGVEGSRFFKDTKQLDNHAQKHPSHPVRGFPQGKTAWICAKVSENYNRGDYDAYLTRPTPKKAEFINYLYIPEGSKIVALWYVSRHYVSLNAKLNYIMQVDDDVILPSNYLLPFDSFVADPKVMSVVLPLHAVNMKQEDPTKPAWFVSWQELEYRSVGYIKYCTSRMGSALFCHGAASFWRKAAFDEVLNRHDTMHNGDDVQMGLNLHGLRGVLTIPGVDATKGFKIDTAWHAAIGTQVPLCWAHQSDFKQILQKCLLGITAGFGEPLLQRLFRKWKSVPCSCGEPSLFFQRGMGWDTTEHRFVGKYFLLFWTCMKTFNRRNVILALTALSQIYITFVDATRLFLIPLALMYQSPYIVLAAFGSAWGSAVISMLLFNVFILRKRGHIPPPYSAIWLFPLYKFVCVFWFRTCATIYNLLWYLPFNQNKHQIQTRMFSCDCQENGCAHCRYRPPFFYYSQQGHMPPGPRDMKEKWPAHPLAQWHVLDRSILRNLFSQLVDSAFNRAAKRFQTAKTKLKLSNHLKSNANRFKNMAVMAVKAANAGGGRTNDGEPEREPKHLLAKFAKQVEPMLTGNNGRPAAISVSVRPVSR